MRLAELAVYTELANSDREGELSTSSRPRAASLSLTSTS